MPYEQELEVGSNEWQVARNRAELRWCTPEIMLTPANQALQASFVRGMQKVLFGPESAAITIESTDITDNFGLDHVKFLTHVAFLHLPSSKTASTSRPFNLALSLRAMHLTVDQISEMTPEELQSYGYDSFDGVYLELLDSSLHNYVNKSFHHGDRGCRYGFQFYESDTGYADVIGSTGNVSHAAYQIDTGYYGTSGRPRLGTHLEELQVITEVLQQGTPDQPAVERLAQAEQENDTVSFVPKTITQKITPYLYGMFKEAIETPELRNEIARHQYFHVQEPDYLIQPGYL